MKNSLKSLLSFAVALTFGAALLSAQSCAAVDHVSAAAQHSVAASGEASGAVVESGVASGKALAGAAAVPVWMSGAVVQGSGAVATSIGQASSEAGRGLTTGAAAMWDSASGDPAKRPALNRTVGVPAAPATTAPAPVPAARKDPPPSEALKSTL